MQAVKQAADMQAAKQAADQVFLGTCNDCDTLQLLKLSPACADCHTSNYDCCVKKICAKGCIRLCLDCGTQNRVKVDPVTGYARSFRCYRCGICTDVNCRFFGDLKENCHRYCQLECFKNDLFIVQGEAIQGEAVGEAIQGEAVGEAVID